MKKSSGAPFYFSRSTLYWLLQFFVFSMLIWYLTSIGISSIVEQLQSVKTISLFLGLSLIQSMNMVRPYRSWIMLNNIGLSISWWRLFRWSQEAWFLSLLTPGKVGDLYKAYRIETEYNTLGPGLLSSILERWIDLMFILVFGFCGVILQPIEPLNNLQYTAGLILLGFILTTTAIISCPNVRMVIRKSLSIIPFKWLYGKVNLILTGLGDAFRKVNIIVLLWILLISAGIWLLYVIGFYFLFMSLGTTLKILPFLSCLAIVLLLQAFPITFLNFGTREAALVMYLSYYNFTSAEALSISFLFVVATLLGLVISSFFWLFREQR